MRTLYQKFETLLQSTTTNFKRYLYDNVTWENRMIGIIGARGVGKTTMILQHIKEKLDSCYRQINMYDFRQIRMYQNRQIRMHDLGLKIG